MRLAMVISSMFFILCLICFPGAAAEEKSVSEVTEVSEEQIPVGYALIMANGMKIKISEYFIDIEKETVFYKSLQSGLSATFPLERIQRVVKYDNRIAEVPDDATPLFVTEQVAGSDNDDGGIPILFEVKKTVVGGGGSSGSSQSSGSRSGSSGNSYRSSSKSGSSSSSSSSRTSSSTSSSSSSSSSGSSNNFLDALFNR